MSETFHSGGVMMWPLLLIGVGVLLLGARAVWLLRDERRPLSVADRPMQAILFWGAISVLVGLLGTAVGIIQMTQAVGRSGTVHPTLLWGGFGVALVTLIFGMLIFLVAAILWFVLRQWAASLAERGRTRLSSH